SRKRTRYSKTSTKNLIVIQDEEVKERFHSILKNQPMMLEKGLNLERNDKMVVPLPIQKMIDALNWNYFCDARSLLEEDFMPISHSSTISMEQILLLYAIMIERSINDGKIIFKEIHDCARKKTGNAYFSSLITSLCLKAQVKTKANLKGPYVQGCITSHNLERLVENVHQLNPIEPSDLTESETDESSNESETEANSVTETEEVESEEELNKIKPIKGPEVLEPRDKPNANKLVEQSIDLELTNLMHAFLNTMKKSKSSTMMDIMKFMYNQQQAY
ncbi:hypothetical protein Gogos_022326, partial [Gossypium gossypioides]|nr:hypothetical protein [Gossypium gossypioides]